MRKTTFGLVLLSWMLAFSSSASEPPEVPAAENPQRFATSDRCQACHNELTDGAGADLSFGVSWRASMMANAARDPYWQAAVRREVSDHPSVAAAIEDECSKCHMPMARYDANRRGGKGEIFASLAPAAPAHAQAMDGVSCALCHQLQPDGFGQRESFVGGFVVDDRSPWDQRSVLGPFDVDAGRSRIMKSASAFEPAKGEHLQRSEMCATCHTLITHAYGPDGQVVGELPEQVPYLEWQASAFHDVQSCQSCHMPEVPGEAAVSSVWGKPRDKVSAHLFRGGNFFVLGLLNQHRAELGVTAQSPDLGATVGHTKQHLGSRAAKLRVELGGVTAGQLLLDVSVTNLAGHKLPTAYPSRRVWLHVVVKDSAGAQVFESGALRPDGSIAGNDNDADATKYEPHHRTIGASEAVQIYEAILGGPDGKVTTGLLTATRYLKDSRIPPRGFDKTKASPEVAVHGDALADGDFVGGSDRVRYEVPLGSSKGPWRAEVVLRYQPIGFRWAHNLGDVKAAETARFVKMYQGASGSSSVVLARAELTATAPPPPPEPPAETP